MIEQDTVKLLRECGAGVKMGVQSISGVIGGVRSEGLRKCLSDCRDEHTALGKLIDSELERYHDRSKEPSPIAEGMSSAKTGFKMAFDSSDSTAADLVTDGCAMGVKSLSRYLNRYAAADERSKDIAKKLIKLEEKLAEDIRGYL